MSAATVPGAADRALPDPLPLFPLQSVLFPGGRLSLKVFEARYLDLISRCLREGQPFGVVCLRQGTEVRDPQAPAEQTRFESVGVLAELVEVDAEQVGLLKVICRGTQRFAWQHCQADAQGLWWAAGITLQAPDAPQALNEDLLPAARALTRAMAVLSLRNPKLFEPDSHADDAGWVANRWCELLPISLAARQGLMALADPLQRLTLVDGFLRQKQLV